MHHNPPPLCHGTNPTTPSRLLLLLPYFNYTELPAIPQAEVSVLLLPLDMVSFLS